MRRAQGDLAGALQAYSRAWRSASGWRRPTRATPDWQRDLSISWEKLGDVRRAQGDLAGALEAYSAGLAIREKLAAADPGNAGWQRDLIVSHVKLAQAGSMPAQHYRERWRSRAGWPPPARWGRFDAWMVADLEKRLQAAEGSADAP